MQKAKKLITNFRIIILLILLVSAVVAIWPNPFARGVAIRNVISNSSASIAGIESPRPNIPPMSRERILTMNGQPIDTVADYYAFESGLAENRTVIIETNRATYRLVTKYLTENIFDEEKNETITIVHDEAIDLGLRVYSAPTTNIRKGLDLQGGTRVLLEPDERVTADQMDLIITNIEERLNVFGLSDIIVRPVSDLSGNQYVLVEVAGATEEEVRYLVSQQGKFEAKIKDNIVFSGGEDITEICRTADCSGIDPSYGCRRANGQWICRFRFSIGLTSEAAQRQADLTRDLDVITIDGQSYLNETIDLYLDGVLVDSLNIGSELRGRPSRDIQISGSGIGITQQEAFTEAISSMKRLQTILATGSLPVSLEIVKTDTISPFLGDEFIRNSILVAFLAIIAVSVIAFVRYRRFEISIPMVITLLSELLIILGFAALIGWNIDIAAIAGIIIVVGTGVDHQIVISDELLKKEKQTFFNWKERINNAFFIIIAACLTTIVAMIPLMSAGAGLLRGFAITTIIGILVGVLITRPAFASIIEILLKDKL